MKKLSFLFLLISSAAFAQNKSCCLPRSAAGITDQNAVLAMNSDFAKSHAEPLPFVLESPKGSTVSYPVADGKPGSAYLIKAAKPSNKYLFVFQEWWGLNDYIKQEAENLSESMPDVNVMAIDLYDGNVATTREDAQKYMAGMTDARARALINGAFDYAGKDAVVGTIGWCFGGAWSLQTALIRPEKVKACVMYYGMPETDVKKLETLRCDVLGIFGTKDKYINPDVVKTFEANMKKAGKKLTVHNYDAEHAFANPSNPIYNEQATKDAHAKAVAYLKAHLK